MAKAIRETAIPGLRVVDLDLRSDHRGWFKENWQRQKLIDLGLGGFTPVQNNVSYNVRAGVTRGIHAEPWDKLVSVATGRVFGAWVDLRAGDTFGRVVTLELGPETAVFVPRGVGNAFQTLVDDTAYAYLVNDHWSPAAKDSYTFVNLADETLAIGWPIPLERADLSEADRSHPRLAEVAPMPAQRVLVLGAGGQLGRALTSSLSPEVTVGLTRDQLDLTDVDALRGFGWGGYDVVVNASAYTAVDAAESAEGRRAAWATNVAGVAELVRAARQHRFTLVHISSDYVFDGTAETHDEEEPCSPLGVYGQTKAAGDALVATLDAHYLLRSSWVIGNGRNFVATMADLADRGVQPGVVDDQYGRLTFTGEIVRAIRHLFAVRAPYGTYNVTNSGPVTSWADIAESVFVARGRERGAVTRVSSDDYGRGLQLAPRPRHSVLDLGKISRTGFVPEDAAEALHHYLDQLPAPSWVDQRG